ncbi:MAG: FHA domain-containing protein [Deltaproteobacteria bacterium]|nr:MAG: FHA domain-containing protein [Deltaproteobacteria bacterium]
MAVKFHVTLPDGREGYIEVTEKPLLIGRGEKCDLQLIDERSSSKHCSVFIDHKRTYIKDHESKNGTYVNDKRIDEPTRIYLKDKVLVGGTKLFLIAEEMTPKEKHWHFKIKEGDDSFTLPEMTNSEMKSLDIENASKIKEDVAKEEEDKIKKEMFKDLEDLTQKSIVKKIRVLSKTNPKK